MSGSNPIPYDINVSNFVSVKLSGKHNYFLWKAQMLCLLNSINICGILDDTFVGPTFSGQQTVRQYDNLVRGWIFGSVSEDVLAQVYSLHSVKDVWEKLESSYDHPMHLQEDSTRKVTDVEIDDAVEKGANSLQVLIAGEDTLPTEVETKKEDAKNSVNKIGKNKKLKTLKSLIIKGDWPELQSRITEDKGLATKAISSDGSTILHFAVGIHQNYIVKQLLEYVLHTKQVVKKRDSDGSTALHIAAIVGNIDAAKLLVETNKKLLEIEDKTGDRPWHKAYKNMHLDTIAYFLNVADDHSLSSSSLVVTENGSVNLIVNAVSAKQYGLASMFWEKFPNAASKGDQVLTTLAKTFPSGLGDGEKLIYPSFKGILEMLRKTALLAVYLFSYPAIVLYRVFTNMKPEFLNVSLSVLAITAIMFLVPFIMLASAFAFICLLILIVCFPFFLLYFILWKGANILAFPPIRKIENKIMEHDEAKKFLVRVCNKIDEMNTDRLCYTRPILEAACHNAYEVVDEILSRSPEAIQSKDKNGYDIIQLAIINRSEKIYNLIYDVDEHKNLHKTYKDSFGNNILHLAGRLAPLSVLNQRTGAALQLQRELQWLEEVKKLVIPTYITEENIYKETPDMVFLKEHKDLVKDGEQWMKTTSESCSITAALIITIVFAAAITVPGGNNQEKGTPLLKKETAFIIFAISDAISLFASSTALLVFLSILTARFAEKDFLVSLPWRLFIGLFSLLLSTTTMMVAFSATLFLIFCDKKLWMLGPICVLAFTPIAFFVGLQFPLMVDLFSSTYLPIFGKQRKRTLKDLFQRAYVLIFHMKL